MLALGQRSLERRSLARNEVLFRQGDKVAAIYFVEAGRLRLEWRTFDGRSLILGTTPTGELFVEAALFSDVYHCGSDRRDVLPGIHDAPSHRRATAS